MDDDFDFVVSTKVETQTREEIKRKFYRAHRFVTKMWQGEKKVEVLRPITIADDSDYSRDRWIVIYYRSYIVEIEQGSSSTIGPHCAKLYYCGSSERVWLGTCQLSCNFYHESGLRKRLRRAIKTKAYFASKESNEEEFETSSPSEDLFTEEARDPIIRIKRKGHKTIVVKAPSLRCPICKEARRNAGALRRHVKVKHKRTLVYMHRARIVGVHE